MPVICSPVGRSMIASSSYSSVLIVGMNAGLSKCVRELSRSALSRSARHKFKKPFLDSASPIRFVFLPTRRRAIGPLPYDEEKQCTHEHRIIRPSLGFRRPESFV
jgi:hypothetical protein